MIIGQSLSYSATIIRSPASPVYILWVGRSCFIECVFTIGCTRFHATCLKSMSVNRVRAATWIRSQFYIHSVTCFSVSVPCCVCMQTQYSNSNRILHTSTLLKYSSSQLYFGKPLVSSSTNYSLEHIIFKLVLSAQKVTSATIFPWMCIFTVCVYRSIGCPNTHTQRQSGHCSVSWLINWIKNIQNLLTLLLNGLLLFFVISEQYIRRLQAVSWRKKEAIWRCHVVLWEKLWWAFFTIFNPSI